MERVFVRERANTRHKKRGAFWAPQFRNAESLALAIAGLRGDMGFHVLLPQAVKFGLTHLFPD